MEKLYPKQEGELNASEAVKLFDNIQNESGEKLTKSEKRARLRIMFIKLYQNKEKNLGVLEDGRQVPLVVKRQDEGRGACYYLNTAEAPLNDIARCFAKKWGIIYRGVKRPLPKGPEELIAADVKHLFDNVTADGKKLSGFKKQDKLQGLFRDLYNLADENVCLIEDGTKIPIIVERIGINNRVACCLNATGHRFEVLSAFASWAGCDYLIDKENAVIPPEKKEGELTTRECAKIFHKVDNRESKIFKRHASERLKDWFSYIYAHPSLNSTTLPNKVKAALVVYRQSYAQKCLCLNTADEIIKPFVLKRIAEITNAEICFENLKLKPKSHTKLYKAIITLAKAEHIAKTKEDKDFYHAYAQKAYNALSPQSKEITVGEWLARMIDKKHR